MKTNIEHTLVNERSRAYVYASGFRLEYKDVEFLNVSASGGHRLTMKDKKHRAYVAPGWIAIELDCDDWVK